MKATRTFRVLPALLIAAGVTATAAADASRAVAQETGAQPAALSNEEFEALYRARQDSARMRFTDADVEFVTGMISHHAQALVMSELAPTHGAGASVQTLAARIINAQQDEIALMQRWLDDRGQPVPQVKIDGLDLEIALSAPVGEMQHEAHEADEAHAAHDAHDVTDHHMPGMLTREQLEELDAAFGPEFDRLFLTYMIQHHSGAVTMVDDLLAVDGAAQDGAVFKLASDIQVDQITEIARMERMLAAMTAASPAAGSR